MSKISLSARYRHLFHVIDQLLLDHRIIVVYSSFTGRKSSALTNILIIAGVQSSHFNLSPPLQNRNQSRRLRNAPHSFCRTQFIELYRLFFATLLLSSSCNQIPTAYSHCILHIPRLNLTTFIPPTPIEHPFLYTKRKQWATRPRALNPQVL